MTAADQLRKHERLELGREFLLLLLEGAFGPLPDDAVTRVMAAEADQLLEWTGRLSASTLDDVLAG